MFSRLFYADLPSRLSSAVSRRWYDWRVSWYAWDKEPWVFALVLGLIAAIFVLALQAVYARQDHRRNLVCLARNVYFEARGEPAAGQYAVAEVTMNRKTSGRYPDTVCGVVYQKNWDPLRKRYVGAFSWTEFDSLPTPMGEDWLRAWEVAEGVYYGREPPVLEGAMFFHATYIKPDWARGKRPLARIGGHVFYK
jgi:spore germination cell wall hydrolase CwlJ-like protein